MKPFILIFNGPAAGGKSTTAREIWKYLPHTALISLDDLKHSISDYKTDKFCLSLASDIALKMTKEYISNGVNVILDKAFCREEYVKPFVNYAKRKKIKFLIYNFEAPWEDIKKRIVSRKSKMTLKKSKCIYEEYRNNLFEVNGTFDTSKLSIKKNVNEILKDIKNSC